MNIKRLTKVVRNPRTTAEWIENEIGKTDSGDTERLCVLATSEKLTTDACRKLYDSCKSAKLVIALAKNPVAPETYRTEIMFDAYFGRYGWDLEERKSILKALEQNPQNILGDRMVYAALLGVLEEEACNFDKRDDGFHESYVFAYKGYQCYHDDQYAELLWCPPDD